MRAWYTPNFSVGGVIIEIHQSLSLTQTYETVGGQATRRMASGRGLRQTYWLKTRSVISGQGILPPGLAALDLSVPITVACPRAQSIASQANSILLPASRRTDVTPQGWAFVNGLPKRTSLSMNNHTANLGAINGADYYLVQYHPQILGFVDLKVSEDRTQSQTSWDITIEEV